MEETGLIQLTFRESKPIYEQVKDGIRKLVVSNALGADEKLPCLIVIQDSIPAILDKCKS